MDILLPMLVLLYLSYTGTVQMEDAIDSLSKSLKIVGLVHMFTINSKIKKITIWL